MVNTSNTPIALGVYTVRVNRSEHPTEHNYLMLRFLNVVNYRRKITDHSLIKFDFIFSN